MVNILYYKYIFTFKHIVIHFDNHLKKFSSLALVSIYSNIWETGYEKKNEAKRKWRLYPC